MREAMHVPGQEINRTFLYFLFNFAINLNISQKKIKSIFFLKFEVASSSYNLYQVHTIILFNILNIWITS